jgi:hypothetical protein
LSNRPVRRRISYILAVIFVLLLGLASRRYPALFPAILGKYPGDVLWALMVFLGWGIIFPRRSTFQIFLCTLAASYCVEFCKFYRAPWIDNVRDSTVGHLVLGSTFSWENLIAYTIGASIGAVAEGVLLRKCFATRSNVR